MFKSVIREASLAERTEQQIQELILSKVLKGGERLPSERELGEQIGVSKTVIREAIRSLSAKGLVDVRMGSGMYVQHLGPELLTNPLHILLRSNALKPENIQEVREALEIKIASLAAERADAADIDALEQAVTALQKRPMTAAEFAEADLAFHNALAAAADNPLFTLLVSLLNNLMLQVREQTFNSDGELSATRALRHHQQILSHIKLHDVAGARQAMIEHLAEARETWERVLGTSKPATKTRKR
jgi:GntR family transcriptional regulator, transcriptional repressor for pyruvate dehydrogenase complex